MFGWSADKGRGVRAIAYAVTAVALGGVLAVVPLGFSPEQVANATGCISSVTCNPANIPMLVESGVLSGTTAVGTTATTTVAASSGFGWGTVAKLALGAAQSAMGFLGIRSALDGGVTGPGVLSANGFVGQEIQTDSTYTPPSTFGCKTGTSQSALILAGGSWCETPQTFATVWGSGTMTPQPHRISGTSGTIDFQVTKTSTVTGPGGWVIAYPWCRTGTGTPYQGNGNSGYKDFQADSTITYTAVCGAADFYGFTWQTRDDVTQRNGQFSAATKDAAPSTQQDGLLKIKLDCMKAGGVITRIDFDRSQVWTPGDTLKIADATCEKGDVAVGVGVDWTPNGGETGTVIELKPDGSGVLPAIKELPATYPDCFTALAKACLLILERMTVDQGVQSCGSAGQLCEGWAQDPNAETNYRCRYGSYPVDLNLCSAYRASGLVGILPNVREDGSIIPYTDPVPDPLPNPVQNPDGSPGSLPAPSAPADDPESNECWPSGWGVFNPVSWVYMPIKCAIRELFVPDPVAVQTDLATAARAWDDTAPVKATRMVSGLLAAIPDGVAGCSGITVNWPALEFFHSEAQTFQFLNACDEPLSTVAAFTSAIGAAGMLWWGTLAVIRYGSAVFGFVGIGGKKDD